MGRKVNKCLYYLMLIGIGVSCNGKDVDYVYYKAIVTEMEPIHNGHGFYKQTVSFNFILGDSLMHDRFLNRKVSRIYSLKYNVGDSIIVRYPQSESENGEIVKLFYIKSRNYHVR